MEPMHPSILAWIEGNMHRSMDVLVERAIYLWRKGYIQTFECKTIEVLVTVILSIMQTTPCNGPTFNGKEDASKQAKETRDPDAYFLEQKPVRKA